MDKKNVLLLIPYFGNRSGKAVFSTLQDNEKFNVITLNTRMKKDYDLNYLVHSNVYYWDEADDLNDKIVTIIEKENVDQVVPTKDPLVKICSLLQQEKGLEDKFFLPEHKIINFLQNKAKTYDFFSDSEVTTPTFYIANVQNANAIDSLLCQYGSAFLKPQKGFSGQNVKKITDLEEIKWNDNFIICEPLIMPEYNQTFVIKNGNILGGITYKSERTDFSPTTKVQVVQSIPDGKIAMSYLMKNSTYGETDGIYNIDFMKNGIDTPVLNEINPGRFPAGAYPLRKDFKKLIDIMLD